MTAKRFKFVSPGVKINEIDRSVITTNNGAIGPTVVGRFQRGPGLVPVTVGSYVDFDNAFGPPTRGVVNSTRSDVWRTGQVQSPTYAAYGAEAWLKNSSPLTVVRTLGVQHPQAIADDKAKAGWKAGSGRSTVSGGGAWGIFMADSGSATTASLAAVIYLREGEVELSGTNLAGTPVQDSKVFVKSVGNNCEFRLVIKNGAGTEVVKTSVNLNKSSSKHIRKILNTNPVLTNVEITPASALKTYWLGETFETFVSTVVSNQDDDDGVIACVVPLENTLDLDSPVNLGDHLGVQAQPAKTGWVISQDLNSLTASFDPKDMPKLFRFSTLGGEEGDSSGEWEQKNVKISIEDVKASNNSFNKYGSFTVKVRKMTDSDKKQEVLETFSGVNLDPTSPNYIARVIGDKKVIWDSDQERHKTLGSYENRSNFIRVEMDTLLEQGALDPVLLPFGFFTPPSFIAGELEDTDIVNSGSTLVLGPIDAGLPISCSLLFPTLPMVSKVTRRGDRTYLGMESLSGNGRLFNDDVLDLLRAKPQNVSTYEAGLNDTLIENSVVFTLDDVKLSGSAAAEWVAGSRKLGESLTALSASVTGSDEGYRSILNAGFNQFTMPLFGGTNGFRIDEKDPLRNKFMTGMSEDDLEGKSNYAFYSLKRSVDSVADPEALDMNLLTAPGVTNVVLTNRIMEVCEQRADALAIIDIEGGYRPESDPDNAEDLEADRLGSVQETISAIKQRDLNSSYGCTYYPWVKVRDSRENGEVWMPPSVVALGTMASSQEVSAVWFAPAGFNRGGLDRGSAGLTVTEVREVLKATQRDDLYEVNINPIARFPAEGIVIFGQKTLQATPSALDRINVRRLVLFLKKQVSRIASGLLFDQNIKSTWQRFINEVNPFMDSVKAGGGIVEYKVVLDETTTTPDLIDRNTMYAKIFIKPAYAIEFIGIDFVITNSGASFDDL
jgi:hypothetical protein